LVVAKRAVMFQSWEGTIGLVLQWPSVTNSLHVYTTYRLEGLQDIK